MENHYLIGNKQASSGTSDDDDSNLCTIEARAVCTPLVSTETYSKQGKWYSVMQLRP